MYKLKKQKGITLIALLITVIVLLIISSVNIFLGDNGIINKSQLAKHTFDKAENEEDRNLAEYDEKILKILNGRDGEINLKECMLEINETGKVVVSNIPNLFSYTIIVNNKCLETTKNNPYYINGLELNVAVTVYVIAIDEDGNLYKSNSVDYTPKRIFLYNNGDKCNNFTGEWLGAKDSGANYDFNSYNYIKLTSNNSSCIGVNIYTKNLIDLSPYSTIKMEVSFSRLYSAGGIYFGAAKNNLTAVKSYAFTSGDCYIVEKSTTGNHVILSCNISNLTGSWHVGLQDQGYNMDIYSIWLE